MIFVSYVTKNTPYEKVLLDRLWPGLVRWKLDNDIEYIKDLGTWQKNTSYKGEFIWKMLNKHKQDVCFLDADAEIWKYPKALFEVPDDKAGACHYLDWFKFWRGVEGHSKRELLSGERFRLYKV